MTDNNRPPLVFPNVPLVGQGATLPTLEIKLTLTELHATFPVVFWQRGDFVTRVDCALAAIREHLIRGAETIHQETFQR